MYLGQSNMLRLYSRKLLKLLRSSSVVKHGVPMFTFLKNVLMGNIQIFYF